MFAVPTRSPAFAPSVAPSVLAPVARAMACMLKAPLFASLVLGFVATTTISVSSGNAGVTGSSSHGKHSTRIVRKGSNNNVSSGSQGRRMTKRHYSGDSVKTNSRTGNSRIYVKRKSIVDGNPGANVSSHGKITVRSGRSSNAYGGIVRGSLSRSGVRYENRGSVRYVNPDLKGFHDHSGKNFKRHGGLVEIAGGDHRNKHGSSGGIVKRYLRDDSSAHQGPGYYRGSNNIVILGAATGGITAIAGGYAGESINLEQQTCDYGTYCTIDLGGPKIITFNDVADIENGEIAQEELSEEEYQKKYGTK